MAKASWLSRVRENSRSEPKEVFNWFLFLCTGIWAFSGVAKGFDEGNIASAVVMPIFMQMYNVDDQSEDQYDNTKGWIVAIATAGAVFGCLFCAVLTKRFGRKIIMQGGTIVYMAGIFGQVFSIGSLGGLYASRFIAGMGIGVTTALPSMYISEIAPPSIRGLLTLMYAACQQLGVVFGFFFNYGITKHYEGQHLQYQLATALQLVPAVIWGIGTFFTIESPRYLLSKNRRSKALMTLARLRGAPESHPYVRHEFEGIELQLNHEIEAVAGSSALDLMKETLVVTANRRRFVLVFLTHVFSQWSGANAITQYAPTILGYLGVQGNETKFLTTGIYGIVKFTSTLIVAVFIIDLLGRRPALMSGVSLQIITLCFLAIYMGVTKSMTPEQVESSPSAKAASTASIVAIFLHAVAWSLGWFSMPYLISAEVFPIRIRSLNVSILTAFHWAFYFACSRAMPSLLAATDRFGAFIFFACICCISLAYIFLALPETVGLSLESMDALFERPWYTAGRAKRPEVRDDESSISATEKGAQLELSEDVQQSTHNKTRSA